MWGVRPHHQAVLIYSDHRAPRQTPYESLSYLWAKRDVASSKVMTLNGSVIKVTKSNARLPRISVSVLKRSEDL
jgi:hypothetical protein